MPQQHKKATPPDRKTSFCRKIRKERKIKNANIFRIFAKCQGMSSLLMLAKGPNEEPRSIALAKTELVIFSVSVRREMLARRKYVIDWFAYMQSSKKFISNIPSPRHVIFFACKGTCRRNQFPTHIRAHVHEYKYTYVHLRTQHSSIAHSCSLTYISQ